MTVEQAGNVVGILLAALIAGWVRFDAQKHGFRPAAALGWSIGVFLLMILFLPAYLWVRRGHSLQTPNLSLKAPRPNAAPIAGVPCPYCGYENVGNPDYCGKCGRQMRSSTEIHR